MDVFLLLLRKSQKKVGSNHSHKKRQGILETRSYYWCFCLNLKCLGWPYRAYIKTVKIASFARNCTVKMTLRLFYPLSVVMTMLPRLLRKFRRSLQIKKSIQMLRVCYSLLNSQNIPINQYQWKMVGYRNTSNVAKKAAEVAQKKEQ